MWTRRHHLNAVERYTNRKKMLVSTKNCSSVLRRLFSTNHSSKANGMKHLIFGANTDVGKTVITAGLIRACRVLSFDNNVDLGAHYIKPLQCGGSDQGFIGRHAAEQIISSSTLFRWETPASPHTSSRLENLPVSDTKVVTALQKRLEDLTIDTPDTPIWVETAGGVLSPSSSSPSNKLPEHAKNAAGWGWMTQGDLYRQFRGEMDVVMIGDGRLGGISASLSSLESLLSRGYNVVGFVVIETGYSNRSAIQEYVSRSCAFPFGSDASIFDNPSSSVVSLPALPPEPEPLMDWYESAEVSEVLQSFVKDHLWTTWERKRLRDLTATKMPEK